MTMMTLTGVAPPVRGGENRGELPGRYANELRRFITTRRDQGMRFVQIDRLPSIRALQLTPESLAKLGPPWWTGPRVAVTYQNRLSLTLEIICEASHIVTGWKSPRVLIQSKRNQNVIRYIYADWKSFENFVKLCWAKKKKMFRVFVVLEITLNKLTQEIETLIVTVWVLIAAILRPTQPHASRCRSGKSRHTLVTVIVRRFTPVQLTLVMKHWFHGLWGAVRTYVFPYSACLMGATATWRFKSRLPLIKSQGLHRHALILIRVRKLREHVTTEVQKKKKKSSTI